MLLLGLPIEAERPLGGTGYTRASDSGEGETAIARARDPGTHRIWRPDVSRHGDNLGWKRILGMEI